MKKTEKVSDKIEELRLELIVGLTMMAQMATSNYENKKAKEQIDKITSIWNSFFDEWKELQKELQKEVALKDSEESSEEKAEFSKLTGIVKKAF